MKKIFTLVLSVCAITLTTSCSQNPVSGTWAAKESGGIIHYLEFNSSGSGTYYFESDITGTSSPAKFSYEITEFDSSVLNDKVSFSATSMNDVYSSTVLEGELISPTMLKCSSITQGGSFSLTFKKQ